MPRSRKWLTNHPGPPSVYSLSCCYWVELLSRVWLFCSPMGCSPPGSSVHEISQARIQERVAISFSRRSVWPRDWARVCCTGSWVLQHWATREASSGAVILCTDGTGTTMRTGWRDSESDTAALAQSGPVVGDPRLDRFAQVEGKGGAMHVWGSLSTDGLRTAGAAKTISLRSRSGACGNDCSLRSWTTCRPYGWAIGLKRFERCHAWQLQERCVEGGILFDVQAMKWKVSKLEWLRWHPKGMNGCEKCSEGCTEGSCDLLGGWGQWMSERLCNHEKMAYFIRRSK